MITTPKRILVVSSSGDIAGAENYLLSVFRHMPRDRYQPLVWLPQDGTFREALDKLDVEYLVDPTQYGWLKPQQEWYDFLKHYPERVRQFVHLIKDREIALVHSNSNMMLEGMLAARVAGVHHIHLAHLEFQTDIPLWQRMPLHPETFSRLMEECSGRIVAVSHSVAATYSPPVLPEKISVIHNGLEKGVLEAAGEARSKRAQTRAELRLPANAVVVIAAGRISPDKGFDFYVEAARTVLATHSDVFFLLAGGAENADFSKGLEQQVAESGMSENFRFLGFRTDILDLFGAADIFALTSRREGHPAPPSPAGAEVPRKPSRMARRAYSLMSAMLKDSPPL